MEQNIPPFMNNRGAGLLAQGHKQGELPNQAEMPDESNVAPEEQEQYDKFVANALMFIHGEQSDQLIEQLGQGEPDQALANVVVGVIIMLQESAVKAGKPLGKAVLFNGGEEIINELINTGITAGVIQPEDDEDAEGIQQDAFLMAVDMYGAYALEAGLTDQEEAAEEMRAGQAGEYDDILDEQQPQQQQPQQQMQQPQGQPQPQGVR
jgi:hypothetical protein